MNRWSPPSRKSLSAVNPPVWRISSRTGRRMRITSLELHNIKSYAEPVRIDLTHGVNAVCGSNGSGKTTVLEAIGFALFDFLPYPQAAFLREGHKWGMV